MTGKLLSYHPPPEEMGFLAGSIVIVRSGICLLFVPIYLFIFLLIYKYG